MPQAAPRTYLDVDVRQAVIPDVGVEHAAVEAHEVAHVHRAQEIDLGHFVEGRAGAAEQKRSGECNLVRALWVDVARVKSNQAQTSNQHTPTL